MDLLLHFTPAEMVMQIGHQETAILNLGSPRQMLKNYRKDLRGMGNLDGWIVPFNK